MPWQWYPRLQRLVALLVVLICFLSPDPSLGSYTLGRHAFDQKWLWALPDPVDLHGIWGRSAPCRAGTLLQLGVDSAFNCTFTLEPNMAGSGAVLKHNHVQNNGFLSYSLVVSWVFGISSLSGEGLDFKAFKTAYTFSIFSDNLSCFANNLCFHSAGASPRSRVSSTHCATLSAWYLGSWLGLRCLLTRYYVFSEASFWERKSSSLPHWSSGWVPLFGNYSEERGEMVWKPNLQRYKILRERLKEIVPPPWDVGYWYFL